MACEAHSNDARDAKRMARGRAGGAKGVRIAVRGACGAEISRQCVGCEARGLDNVGELQAVRACRMGLSKSPKSLRYNFPVPVCGTYRFTSSQVDAVLDLSEIESASPFKFITQTFAFFASRWHAKCAQMTCATRNAWRRGAWEGRKMHEWPCAKHAAQRCAGNAWFAKCAAWTMWANCKRCGRVAWGEGVGRCNGTCGAVRRGASGRRVLGARAGA